MNQNELVQQILSYILNMSPGGGLLNMFSPMVSSWLSPQSSRSNRFVWPTSGSTPAMSAVEYMNNAQAAMFSNPASTASNELQMRALVQYNRALDPNASEEALKTRAQSMLDNPANIPSFILSHLDPYDARAGITEASNLSSTLQKRNFTPWDIKGATYAAQVSETVFGKDGKSGMVKDIMDNPSKYGNLKLSEVMYLGQELAHTDPNGFKTDDGKFDSTKFKQSIQAVSRAIEPWKDIFGSDMPELLNKLEALTGQGLALQQQSVRATGSRLSSIMQATGANIQHISGYRDALAADMGRLPMENRSILGAHNVAGDMVLGLSNNGMKTLTTEEFQRLGGRFYSGTAASNFSDRYSLAYAMWEENKFDAGFRSTALQYKTARDRAKAAGYSDEVADKIGRSGVDVSNKVFRDAYDKAVSLGMTHDEAVTSARNDISKAQFRRAYDEAVASGMSKDEALKHVSGAKSLQDLELYRYSDKHIDMVKSGEGAKASRQATMDEIRGWVITDYVNNRGKYTERSDTAATLVKNMSSEEFTDFMSKGMDEKKDYIKSKLGLRNDQVARTIANDLSESFAAGARVVTGEDYDKNTAEIIARTTKQEISQGKRAQEYERFAEATRRLSSPGELRGVLEKIRESGGKADVKGLIKGYTGGNDVLDAILMSQSTPGSKLDEATINDTKSALHFSLNNYLELGKEGSAFNRIYKDLTSEGGNKAIGTKVAAALGSLDQRTLNKMDDKQRTEYVNEVYKRVQNSGKSAKADDIARDTYLDQQIGSVLKAQNKDNLEKKQRDDITKLQGILDTGTHTSIESLRAEAKRQGIDENLFNDITGAAKIGDIEGIDPIMRLVGTLEKLAEGIAKLISNIPLQKQ